MSTSKLRSHRELRSPTNNSPKPSSPRTPTISNGIRLSPGVALDNIPEITCEIGDSAMNHEKNVTSTLTTNNRTHTVTFSTPTSPKEFTTMNGAIFRPFSSPSGNSCRASDASSEKELKWKIRQEGYLEELESIDVDLEDEERPSHCLSCLSGQVEVILYMSAFAIIGSSARVYLGRIFGYDCEFPPPQEDYVSLFSTCVTSTGLTDQRGGALFIDLPANMLGSFFMGLVTPLYDDIPVLSWLKADHRLQEYPTMHLSLRTALCGSLTTFASWNTQMIMMIVGRQGVLGPQVVQALFGYLIGVACAVGSMQFGRHLGMILYKWRNGSSLSKSAANAVVGATFGASLDEDEESNTVDTNGFSTTNSNSFSPFRSEEPKSTNTESAAGLPCRIMDVIIHGKYSPLIFTALLLSLFLVGDFKMNSTFHKDMWICALFAPPGTLLRWRLSLVNGKWGRDSELLKYFPFGTFFANILACVISASVAATMYVIDRDSDANSVNTTRTAILMFLLKGLKSGFAGNLSTVSTFAKEIVLLSEKRTVGPAYFYACVTVFSCCLMSLAFYLPISGDYS